MAKKVSISSEMKRAQEQMKKKIAEKDKTVRDSKAEKKSNYKPVKEQYKEIRESLKDKEPIISDDYENDLIKSLFNDPNSSKTDSSDATNKDTEPKQEEESVIKHRDGL